MCRDISEEEFNLKLNKGTSQIHLFRGKKAKEIGVGVKEHLDSKKKTDAVIILGGGNDLPTSKNNPTSPEIIADTLINIGIDCTNAGIPAEKICLSSVLPRQEAYMQGRRKRINDFLRDKCKSHKFTFIEKENIILSRHIKRDGVHLNRAGTEKLTNNFLNVLNGGCDAVREEDCSVGRVVRGEDCSARRVVREEDCFAGQVASARVDSGRCN